MRLQSTFVCVALSMGFLTANRKCVPFLLHYDTNHRVQKIAGLKINAKTVIGLSIKRICEPKRKIKCFMKMCREEIT